MGRYDTPDHPGKETVLRFPAPLTVIAASEQIEALRGASGASWIADAHLIPLELDQDIAAEHLDLAGLVVIQVDPSVARSMNRIERVRALRPNLPQIVALESADLGLVRTLVRQGVSDVVSLPLSAEELLQVTIAVMEVEAGKSGSRDTLAPLIAVTRSIGGGGATTLATHLAACLADSGEARSSVCIFDLDIQFGRVAEVMGLSPKRNLTDLLDAGVRIDASLLRSVVASHPSGVSVVAAPQEIVPLESIDASQLHRVIELARREFDFVLLDIPSNLTNWNLSVLAVTDSIVMLVEQNLASLRQARRRLQLFGTVGIDSRIVSVVVNKVERRLFGSISLADVEQTLHHDVLCALRADSQNIAIAQDQGVLVNEVRSKSAYVSDVAKLAELLENRFNRDGRT
jgi:pilus assembly protein CpaE